MGYQGWKNYETWAVALWIDNEEPSYKYWHRLAQDTLDSANPASYETLAECAMSTLSDVLKQEFADGQPELDGVWSDLLSAAVGNVDWYELAQHYLADKTQAHAEESI